MDFTFEEQELMAIYNPGTRLGLIQALHEMHTYLDADERELQALPTAPSISWAVLQTMISRNWT
mgnify:CR=1 FL=1